jgi:hypothetical protein
MSELTSIILATDEQSRNRSLDGFCLAATAAELLSECEALNRLRHESDNLYQRVRALFFL